MNNIVILLGIVVTLATGIPVLIQLLRNHPKGLFVLFFAEMWERFSYYGMRGILIFYLTQHFLFDDGLSSNIYSSYTSLVYLLPLIGGILADRWLGTRKAVAFGALLLVAGHGMMAYEGADATQTLTYQGHAYAVQAEGRGEARQAHIIVDGKPYEFKGSEAGLEMLNLPAGSALPQVIPTGTYTMQEVRDPQGITAFYLAVSLIIMGVGFLKPNISTIVGQLYPQGDIRRDSGFTLYYYGVNLGAFWASALCGLIGQKYGWSWGFGLAGIGMAIGWIAFMLGRKSLQGKGEPPVPEALKKPTLGPLNLEWTIYLGGLVSVFGVIGLFIANAATREFVQTSMAALKAAGEGAPIWLQSLEFLLVIGTILVLSTLVSLVYITWFLIAKCNKVQRERMMLAMVLVFGAVVFFTLFEQAGTSLNLFASRNVDLNVTSEAMSLFGITFATPAQLAAAHITNPSMWIDTTINASQTQSFNAGFILIFAPIFAAMWAFLARKKLDPNPTLKFGLGLMQVGLGFLVVVLGYNLGMVNSAYQMPIILLGLLYLLHTTGELFLSPVGLSEITKLSVPSVVSFMMAVWFLSSSIAQYIGGIIAGALGSETVGGQVLDPAGALKTSIGGFTQLGWVGVGCGVVFILLSFLIKGWAHGVNDADNHPGPDATDRGQEDRNAANPEPSAPHA